MLNLFKKKPEQEDDIVLARDESDKTPFDTDTLANHIDDEDVEIYTDTECFEMDKYQCEMTIYSAEYELKALINLNGLILKSSINIFGKKDFLEKISDAMNEQLEIICTNKEEIKNINQKLLELYNEKG
ncbi:hypothetical protein ACTXHA_29985 [Burkholderia cenocepacia]